MKIIEFKNENADAVFDDIISVRFSQGLIRELIEKHQAAPSPNMSAIGILKDHYGTLAQTVLKLERKLWLISNNQMGAN